MNWLAIQDQPSGEGDRGGELDGDDSDDSNVSADEMPFATPIVEGWTVVGVGGQQGLLFRNGSGGHVNNGLLCNTAEGIEIEDKTDEVEDAYQRFLAGDLTLSNIVVTGGVDALDYDGDSADGDAELDAYAEANGVVSGEIDGLDAEFNFDPSGTYAIDQLNLEVGQGSGHSWATGWTLCDQRGLFAFVQNVESIESDNMNVTLYPNPTNNISTLRFSDNNNYNVTLVNTLGVLVSQMSRVSGHFSLPSVPAGTYLILVEGTTQTTTLKWLVQ